MKKILIAVIMVALVFSVAGAKKKDKAGKVIDGVYLDAKYNFSLDVPDVWKYKIKKNKDNIRLILTKKQYDTPTQFLRAPSYTTVPKVTILIDTTSLSLDMFVDSLLSDKFNSKQKKSILSEFPILFGDYKLRKRAKLMVGDVEGIRISAQLRYTIQVQRAGSQSDKADVVTDFNGGSIFFAKQGDKIYMFHFICEWRYFEVYVQEFTNLVQGFKFPEEK